MHESHQFTVPGDAQHAHITGLVESTGYDVSVAGTTQAGNPTRPLTAFVMTGTYLFQGYYLSVQNSEVGRGEGKVLYII